MEPNPVEREAMQQRFGVWAGHWYRLQHSENVEIVPFVTKETQRRCGDVRVVSTIDSTHGWNYDEKVFARRWHGLLVELLQASEPNDDGRPTSLGWFYDLQSCDYLLCGYYDRATDVEPIEVYRVSLRRLRALYPRLVSTHGPLRSNTMLTVKGYGVTVGVVIPWTHLLDHGVVESVYLATPAEERATWDASVS